MLQFLQPIWLWAAAGIIVPILIHLWNIKQRKTLKVGSIALFTQSAKLHSKSLRLSDWLLLLLRCLLLIVLAMLIAKPVWNEQTKTKEKGWIVIKKSEVKEAYQTFQPTIDTLLKQGYTFHCFDENFEEGNLKNTLTNKRDTTAESTLSYWSLLKLLNDKLPSNFPVYLFTDNHLNNFTGNRPDVSLHLKWYIYSTSDTASTWMEKAYQTVADSMCIIKAKSNSFGTGYTYQNASLTDKSNNYLIHADGNKLLITENDSSHQTIEVDTSTLLITIYANGFADDANYLKAAINAIKDFTQHKIKIVTANTIEKIPDYSDWLFWLSDDSIPASKIKNHVFVYDKEKIENAHSMLSAGDERQLTTPENISIYKYVKIDSASFQTVWKNGFNEPLLSRQNGNAEVYHFYSRFNPQWNDLVWNSSFLQVIYNLIFDDENRSETFLLKDKRVIDSLQIQPHFIAQQTISNYKNDVVKKDCTKAFWLIAFVLFFTERILSFRTKKESYE